MNERASACVTKQAREFPFSLKDFQFVQALILKETGISLTEHKKTMVYGRLVRRLRQIEINNFTDYFSLILQDTDERIAFINAMTTNKTQFFREKHHFDYLNKVLIPAWLKKKKSRIRIWSAGCSTGEEPYSIASLFAYHGLFDLVSDCKILATDIDTQTLDIGKLGIYPLEGSHYIPEDILRCGFIRGKGKNDALLKVKPVLQQGVQFNRLNLISTWPHRGSFDLIFCRNVMIYFEKEMQQRLIFRFWQKLEKGGIFIIGHSENMGLMGDKFENIGQTMYRKI